MTVHHVRTWVRYHLGGPVTLTLTGPDGVFLRRWGWRSHWFRLYLYLHRLYREDPGLDLHDHPWPFSTLILWGGYSEWAMDYRGSHVIPRGERWTPECRTWKRGTCHRVRLDQAHRIVAVLPGTVSLVAGGRDDRPWGFHIPGGWVDYRDYDYDTRRPGSSRPPRRDLHAP